MQSLGFILAALVFFMPLFTLAEVSFDGLNIKIGDTVCKPVTNSEDKCIDEKISVGDSCPRVERKEGEGYKQCKELPCDWDKEKAGQCSCGKVTFTDSGGDAVKTPISKCDPNYAGKMSSSLSVAEMKAHAVRAVQLDAIDRIDTGTDEGKQQLSDVLRNYGVPESTAKELATERPEDAKELLKAFTTGVAAEIAKAEEKAGVSLNPYTVNDIVRLTPEQQAEKTASIGAEAPVFAGVSTFGSNSSEGGPPPGGRYGEMFRRLEEKYGLPPGHLAGIAKVESNGNPTICARTSSACGMFQYTVGTWARDSARINGGVPLPLSARFDPEVSAEVTAASMGYYQSRYGELISASGMDPKAALYSLHNLGESGGQRFMRAFAANPNAPVYSALSGIEIRNNPSLYRGGYITLAQAQGNMIAKMTGSTN